MKAVCHVSEPTTIYMFRCTVEVTTYLHEMGKARHGRGYIEDVATPGDGLPFVLGGRLTRARGLLGCLGRRDRCPVQWLAATCRCCDDYATADRPSLLLCLERASGEGCADMTRDDCSPGSSTSLPAQAMRHNRARLRRSTWSTLRSSHVLKRLRRQTSMIIVVR